MATVIDAIRNITGDRWWILKTAWLVVFVYFVMDGAFAQRYEVNSLLILSGIALLLLLSTASYMVSAVINNTDPVLPGFSGLFKMLKNMFSLIFVIVPYGALIYYVFTFAVNSFEYPEKFVYYVVVVILTLALSPFILLPVILYSVKNNVFDAYRLINILKSSGNAIVQFISFIIQYLFVTVFFGLLYKVILDIFGSNTEAISVLFSVYIVLTVLTLFSFFANAYGTAVIEIETEIKTRKNRK